jgi:hypothetical protein
MRKTRCFVFIDSALTECINNFSLKKHQNILFVIYRENMFPSKTDLHMRDLNYMM